MTTLPCAGAGGACVQPAVTVKFTRHGMRLFCAGHGPATTDYERGADIEPAGLPDAMLFAWLIEERQEQKDIAKCIKALEARLQASQERERRVRTLLERQLELTALLEGVL